MPRPLRLQDPRRAAITGVALLASCSAPPPRLDGGDERVIAQVVDAGDCLGATLRPSSAPPPEGLWESADDDAVRRVAVSIGPAEIGATSTRVTRAIDVLEDTSHSGRVHARLDSAVVQIDLLPPYPDAATDAPNGPAFPPRAAAVYALSPTVLVAAYEGCSALQPPAIRYLRRDAAGRIVADAMLRRQSTTIRRP